MSWQSADTAACSSQHESTCSSSACPAHDDNETEKSPQMVPETASSSVEPSPSAQPLQPEEEQAESSTSSLAAAAASQTTSSDEGIQAQQQSSIEPSNAPNIPESPPQKRKRPDPDDDDGADHAEDTTFTTWQPQTEASTCEFVHHISGYAAKRDSGGKTAEYSSITCDEYGNCWRLIVYVNGNGRASNHHLSLFLQVADAEGLPFGWNKSVSYVLTLEHGSGDPERHYAKRNPDKLFKLCPKAIDWGWSQFITSDRIQQDGFVVNDQLTVRASVTVKQSSTDIEEGDAELYLKCAVEEGNYAAVKACLQDHGARVNCHFKDDLYTPLHTACSITTNKESSQNSTMAVLHLLLEQGADGNACNKWKETPLLIAANTGNDPAVQALLQAGADPSLCSEAGWSALTFAAHKVRGSCFFLFVLFTSVKASDSSFSVFSLRAII